MPVSRVEGVPRAAPRPIKTRLEFEHDFNMSTTNRSWHMVVGSLLCIYCISLSWCYLSLVPVPEVNMSDTERFMESSALAVTKALSDGIGHRYVGTMNEEKSAVDLE